MMPDEDAYLGRIVTAGLGDQDERGTARRDGKGAPKRPAGKRGAVRRRFGLLNAFLDRSVPLVESRAGLAAWMLLYRHAKPDGIVTAAVSDLARRAGCCESAMRRALKRLQSAGLVERIKRGTLAGGASVWRLLTPEGEQP